MVGVMLSCLAVRHVLFEDLGTFGPMLERRGYTIEYLEAPLAEWRREGPRLREADLVVVLGGPINVDEVERYAFLGPERRLLAERLHAGGPTLGLCLGAQMMASVLGARVAPMGHKELGWAPITLTPEGRQSCLAPADGLPVLHWHGDGFEIPEGAQRLAFSERCRNQAFLWGAHALGLQFHLEASGRELERWFVGNALEIELTPGVTLEQLRADTECSSEGVTRAGEAVLDAWLRGQ